MEPVDELDQLPWQILNWRNEMSPHPPSCLRWRDTFLRKVIMQDLTLIGIDLGKHSFRHCQVGGVDA